MHLKILETIFIIIASILAILLLLRFSGITKKMSPMKASDFVSSIAGLLYTYVVFAFLVSIFVGGLMNKAVMLLFAASPFIIGKLVTYEKEKFYSIIQILCVILSLVYVVLI